MYTFWRHFFSNSALFYCSERWNFYKVYVIPYENKKCILLNRLHYCNLINEVKQNFKKYLVFDYFVTEKCKTEKHLNYRILKVSGTTIKLYDGCAETRLKLLFKNQKFKILFT